MSGQISICKQHAITDEFWERLTPRRGRANGCYSHPTCSFRNAHLLAWGRKWFPFGCWSRLCWTRASTPVCGQYTQSLRMPGLRRTPLRIGFDCSQWRCASRWTAQCQPSQGLWCPMSIRHTHLRDVCQRRNLGELAAACTGIELAASDCAAREKVLSRWGNAVIPVTGIALHPAYAAIVYKAPSRKSSLTAKNITITGNDHSAAGVGCVAVGTVGISHAEAAFALAALFCRRS